MDAEEAVRRARAWLHEHGIPTDDREHTVEEHTERFRVVFQPPPRMRAGDFTVHVDRETGEVGDVTIER